MVEETVYLYAGRKDLGLPWWLRGKESVCNAGDAGDIGLISGSGRSPGGGHSYPLQCSCLENPMDRGAWRVVVHRVQRVGHNGSDLACREAMLIATTTGVSSADI